MPNTQHKGRSAKTGRFVKNWVVEKYPDSTYLDKIVYDNKKD